MGSCVGLAGARPRRRQQRSARRPPCVPAAPLQAVTQRYDPQYIVKVDDDVYLRLDRVPAAVAQWRQAQADYLGCFKTVR